MRKLTGPTKKADSMKREVRLLRIFTVRLPPEVGRKLRVQAAMRDLTRHKLMQSILTDYVSRKDRAKT